MEAPRWAKEDWNAREPEEEKVVCKDCFFREKDRHVNDKLVAKGACLSFCQVYNPKPVGILFDGEDCAYYLEEGETD